MRAAVITMVGAVVLAAQDTSATVSGEVHDITGAPIPATNAELTLGQPTHTVRLARADTAGEFRFTQVPPGTYTLKLAQSGFESLTLKSIQLASGEQKILPRLRLNVGHSGCGGPALDYLALLSTEQHAGNLRGRVLREQDRSPGPAVAQATLQLLCDDRKICGETKTDPNGDFIFLNLQPRDHMAVRVVHPGFYPLEAAGYEVRAGFESTYWPITLEYCPLGNCDPRLRLARTVVVCE